MESNRHALRRELVGDLMGRYGVGVTKACAVVMISRSLYRYQSCRRDSTGLVMRIHEIAHSRVRYGYRRGFRDNHKRVYRLYREQGLSLRHKRPKRNKSAQRRQPKTVAQAINDIWSMDFVMGQLFDGRRLRARALFDNYSRECLAIDIGQSLRGDDVVVTLTRVCSTRGLPRVIKADNGSEFISKAMDKWA